MVINQNGLPTPWPIDLISILISIASVILFEGRKRSFGWLSKLALGYSMFRPIISLIGSWNSLRVHGVKGFQYPELMLWNVLPLLVVLYTTRKGIESLKKNEQISPSWVDKLLKSCKELFFGSSQSPLATSEEEIIALDNLEAGENRVNNGQNEQAIGELERIYQFIKYPCWGIVTITFIWQIIATIIYAKNQNFATNSQFLTNCTEMVESTKYVAVNCLKDGFCYLTDKRILTANFVVRGFSLLAVSSPLLLQIIGYLGFLVGCLGCLLTGGLGGCMVGICCFPCLFIWDSLEKKWKSINRKTKELIIKSFFYGLIKIIFLTYLIIIIKAQVQGLNTTGLEKVCDIKPTLISSNNGYLQEWFHQSLTALKQIALT